MEIKQNNTHLRFCVSLIASKAFEMNVFCIMWHFFHKAICAQIDSTGGTLPACAQNFLDPTRIISAWDVSMLHAHGSVIDYLLLNQLI